MSSKFDDFLQEKFQDPEILKEFEALQSEHTVIQAKIDAGQKSEIPLKSSTPQNRYLSKYSGRFYSAYPVMETGDSGMIDTAIPEIQNR